MPWRGEARRGEGSKINDRRASKLVVVTKVNMTSSPKCQTVSLVARLRCRLHKLYQTPTLPDPEVDESDKVSSLSPTYQGRVEDTYP